MLKKLVSKNRIKFSTSGVLSVELPKRDGGRKKDTKQTRQNPANGHIDAHRTGALVIQGKAERTGWDCSG